MIEITPRAIDLVSRFVIDMWGPEVFRREGIYSWALRLAEEAFAENKITRAKTINYCGMEFAFLPMGRGGKIDYIVHSIKRVV